ncbi:MULTISPECIES: hypothetical protein [unclassified Ruegeria]|uniref:hypothetical protein n=1 Tax=unclassified Ruegeria TaxID=2625375 RepID=UPI001ADAE77F|nr:MULTISPECIES: hypothetical protein [unclassified Ruegeria]MBO9410239.1 hypothetical protein [Ruegeria sp. R8_1]MBO9414542.1 hypothetical protein [Ruegeria sp. R8_2]
MADAQARLGKDKIGRIGELAEIEKGQRFSHIYVDKGAPLKDSKKARFRISKLASTYFPETKLQGNYRTFDHAKYAQEFIENELGVRFATQSTTGMLVKSWEWFFNRITVLELLDTVTILVMYRRNQSMDVSSFVDGVRRVFKDENLAYDVDEDGGVHPLVDSAFSASRQSSIAALNEERYSATSKCVETIDFHLMQEPVDYIGAIRSAFSANENLFKLMYKVPRLDARSAGEKLGRELQALYSDHPTLQAASGKSLESFKDWINAAHFYRHEQGIETPNQPTEEAAILLVSQGLSFVRWLAQIDRNKGS